MVTQNGIMIRTPVAGISCIGRNTQGVRLINVDAGDRVIDMTHVVKEEEVAEAIGDEKASEGSGNGQVAAVTEAEDDEEESDEESADTEGSEADEDLDN